LLALKKRSKEKGTFFKEFFLPTAEKPLPKLRVSPIVLPSSELLKAYSLKKGFQSAALERQHNLEIF